MEKFYLGISFGFNASACVISNKKGLVAAISQERLNGIKNTKKLPFDAILKCLEIAGTKEIEGVAVSHYEDIKLENLQKYSDDKLYGYNWKDGILNWLNDHDIKIKDDMIVRIKHHNSHAYSAFGFYGLPKDDHFMITSDGFGDGLSGIIRHSKNGIMSEVKLAESVALVYQFVTGALGFKEHQHEGKITGLAAYGRPVYLKQFMDMYEIVGTGNHLKFKECELSDEDEIDQNIIDFDKFLMLKKTVYKLVNDIVAEGGTREDIAASVQEFAERVTVGWILDTIGDKPTGQDAYLAGGLFANVKINQRIKDTGIFRNVYVCPAMGDEGTCVGAAIILALGFEDYDVTDVHMSDKVISGCEVNDCYGWLMDRIHYHGLNLKVSKFDNDADLSDFISTKLANNKIVCLMRGKMEFGPRALCHRSILYNCKDKSTNDWLNKMLSRTEFMPFAPVCAEEFGDDLFKNLDGGRYSAKFMTMTFDGTDEFIKYYPAACHIDNTARPQIVSYDDDQFMWDILMKYYEKTHLKALINTSFNLHNHPIIADYEVGFDSWVKSKTDILVINNVVIERV